MYPVGIGEREKMMERATDRLILKELRPEDSALVMDFYIRNKNFLKPWEPQRDDEFWQQKTHEKIMIQEQKDSKENRALRLWIFEKNRPDKVIGTVALTQIVRGSFLSCFLGYKLDEYECNKGYMREAIEEIIKIAFDELGLHRIEGNVMPKNEKSKKLLSKLGFSYEGRSPKYLKINGQWEDHEHWVLINERKL